MYRDQFYWFLITVFSVITAIGLVLTAISYRPIPQKPIDILRSK